MALPESDVSRDTVTLGDSSNAPDKTTQRERVNPSDKEYSTLSNPIVTAAWKSINSVISVNSLLSVL